MRLQIRQWIEGAKGASLAYAGAAALLLGVAVALIYPVPVLVVIFCLCVSALAVLAALWRRSLIALACAIVCAAFALGCVRTLLSPDPRVPFVAYDGAPAVVMGTIIEDPDVRQSGVQAILETEKIDAKPVTGTLLLQLPIGSPVSYGDTVIARGEVRLPEAFVTDQGAEFDYPKYLRAKGVGAVMHVQNVQVLEGRPATVLGFLYNLKHAFMRLVERTLPEPESGLLEGMLLGHRGALSEKQHDAFVTSGLVHIVVLSGYNLSLVASVLMLLAALVFSRGAALFLAAASVIAFAAMAGLDATVLRAALMALIVILGKWLRRPSIIMRSLVLACAAMILWNPYALLYDPSFVLSFLATFGLITLSAPMERILGFVPERFSMREIAAATIATQTFVLPVLIVYTGKISLVALPANLLALPLVPYAMLVGFVAAVAGLAGRVVAFPFVLVAWALLGAVIFIAQTAAKLPFASVDVTFLQSPLLLLLYLFLAPLAVLVWRREAEVKTKPPAL